MSATDGLLGSTEANVDDLRTLERLARAANEPSPKYLVTMKIDRPNDTEAMAAFNRWKDLVLACTPERILSMVEGARDEKRRERSWALSAVLGLIDGDELIALVRRMSLEEIARFAAVVDGYRPDVQARDIALAAAAARAVPSSLEGRADG